MARECITHHHACDCREERFRELEAENERLRTKLETSQVALKGAEERAKMLLDAKNHMIRSGAFMLIGAMLSKVYSPEAAVFAAVVIVLLGVAIDLMGDRER